ncbi:MAG: GNAT family N-acetyltransferase [Streptosporangiaceae bacterium]
MYVQQNRQVTRVFVMSEARRCGAGQLLLEAVDAAARKEQVTTLRLDTGSHLTEARRRGTQTPLIRYAGMSCHVRRLAGGVVRTPAGAAATCN